MSSGEIHVGDIGTIFRVTVTDQDGSIVDISGASTRLILLRDPYGKKLSKTGAFTTDGTDGKMQYASVSGDIGRAGTWKIQGKVIIPAGTFYTDITEFEVYSNVPE